ncbi:hypothetical protein [Stappia sp. ES.058]|uniref:hypothetical protein n=1 Tax=Stappia sp. ES.058 TaxID=1881061 RepID=UPI00087B2152|nr:hypothetical protein [Stappia sp. ES.058]SDT97639.1 hypothetical protein SAMN05428979_0856 [Stappia sp. ES.058]
MEPQLLALLILVPFLVVFLYSGFHEYRRYKSEGRAKYGLVYDEETGTTHVTGIDEDQDGYDPDDYDPTNYNEPGSGKETEDERT